MSSEAIETYAEMFDGWAEYFHELGAYDHARDMLNDATEMRDTARELHDYGIYCVVGVLLILIAGAGWMAWRWGKNMSIEKH